MRPGESVVWFQSQSDKGNVGDVGAHVTRRFARRPLRRCLSSQADDLDRSLHSSGVGKIYMSTGIGIGCQQLPNRLGVGQFVYRGPYPGIAWGKLERVDDRTEVEPGPPNDQDLPARFTNLVDCHLAGSLELGNRVVDVRGHDVDHMVAYVGLLGR